MARVAGKKRGGRKAVEISAKLLKTNVVKMSAYPLSTIFMKKKELFTAFHDVNEKKGS